MAGVTEQDARALTYLARRLRDETHGANRWDDAGTYASVSKLVGSSLPVAAERVTRHASDPTAKTPGAIHRNYLPGPPEAEVWRPPKAHETCPTHPGGWKHNCACCAADRLADDDEQPTDPTDRHTSIAAARAALRTGVSE